MAVDLIAGANDGRIGAVLIAPDVIAHDGHGRRAFTIIGIGHEAADPGPDAERAEEIAVDIFAVARIDRGLRSGAADTERRIATLPRGEVRELGPVRAEISDGFPR